jgi:predicted CxxxxCH...CXXCH cytochrome family protein
VLRYAQKLLWLRHEFLETSSPSAPQRALITIARKGIAMNDTMSALFRKSHLFPVNSSRKKRPALSLIRLRVVLFLLILVACLGSCGGDPPDLNIPPEIVSAWVFDWYDPSYTPTFEDSVGDDLGIYFCAHAPHLLDTGSVIIYQYHPPEAVETYYDPIEIDFGDLEAQGETKECWIWGPAREKGPVGDWLIVIEIVDGKGNVSSPYEILFKVVHPEGFADPTSENFHTFAIRDAGWQLADCRSCHGTDYAGGVSGPSCLTCHPNTPADCSTCHGSPGSPAPPPDLSDNDSSDIRGVGAHQTHLTESAIARAMACSECHVVPTTLEDPGHTDSPLPAELTFGSLARTGAVVPVWDGTSCSIVYCHGSFPGGNQRAPDWTEVGTGQAACGTCHETPPPAAAGHPQILQCAFCHPRVADDNLNILNKALHINGGVELGP